MVRDREWRDLFTITAMYGEATLLTLALSGFSKAMHPRNRPYLYNTAIDDDEYTRLLGDADCQRSFFSRHTALAFNSALFLSKVTADCYGSSKATAAFWAVSLTAAAAVGVSRYASGQHFPSDVLTGALVGSLVGYGIPWLHGKGDENVEVTIIGNGVMVGIYL